MKIGLAKVNPHEDERDFISRSSYEVGEIVHKEVHGSEYTIF